MIYKILHMKLKIQSREPSLKLDVTSGAQRGRADVTSGAQRGRAVRPRCEYDFHIK